MLGETRTQVSRRAIYPNNHKSRKVKIDIQKLVDIQKLL